MKRLHDLTEYLSFLPFIVIGAIQENGPSWKTIAAAACGGAMAITLPMIGYRVSQQDKIDNDQNAAIADLRTSYVEAKVTMAGMTATIKGLNDNQQLLKEQLEYDKRRRELREDAENAARASRK